jgi:hypothetical protein
VEVSFFFSFTGFVMVRTRKKPRREDVQEECTAEAAEPVEKEVNCAPSIARDEDGNGEEVPAKKKRGRKKKNLSAQKGRGAEKNEKVEENIGFQSEQGIIGDSECAAEAAEPVEKEVNYAPSIDRDEDGNGEEVPANKKRGRKKKNLSAQKNEKVGENIEFQSEQGIVGDSKCAAEAGEPVEKEVNYTPSIDRDEDGNGEKVPAKKKRGRKKKNLSAQKNENVEENIGVQSEQGIVGDSDKQIIMEKPGKKRGRVGVAKKDTEDAVLGNEKDSNGEKLELSSGRSTGTQRVYSLRAKTNLIPKQETAKINKQNPRVNISFPSLCFCGFFS